MLGDWVIVVVVVVGPSITGGLTGKCNDLFKNNLKYLIIIE